MYTSIGLLAFASFWNTAAEAPPLESAWQPSYNEARIQGLRVKKPLAVIVGTGTAGYSQFIQEGTFSPQTRTILARDYVPVYLDTERADHQKVIQALGITSRAGVVLSDRTGDFQAFFHDGLMREAELTRQLTHFAQPALTIRSTQTVPSTASSVSLASATTSIAPPAAPLYEVNWLSSYHEARTTGTKEKKPYALIIGTGAAGQDQLLSGGKLSAAIRKMLADEYIPVYLDATRPENQRLMADLGITTKTGLVLSDRTGNLQAFFHDGKLSETELTTQLQRFADPNVTVRQTATLTQQSTSYYPPMQQPSFGSFAPAMSTRNC